MQCYLALGVFFSALSFGATGLIRESFQGIRPLGMGNANLALAQDSNAIWYNPAALTEVTGNHFNLLDITLGVDSFDTVSRFYNAVFNGEYNRLISSQLTAAQFDSRATFIRRYFAASLFFRADGFWDFQQLLFPEADIYAYADFGAAVAFALPISEYVSLGTTVRGLIRSGADAHISVTDLLTFLGALPEDFLSSVYDYLKTLSGYGYGIGVNIGTLAKIPLGPKGGPRLNLAFTVEDFGKTTFKAIGSGPVPHALPMQMHAGFALQYPLNGKNTLNLAFDMRHLLEPLPFFKTAHLGLEWQHKKFGLRTGMYQGYLTYGASFELLPHTQIHIASYATELGETLYSRGQRFYLAQVRIGFLPF